MNVNENFYRQYKRLVSSVVYSVLNPHRESTIDGLPTFKQEDIEDVCQSVWVKILSHDLDKYGVRYSTIIYRIAHNTALNYLRDSGRYFKRYSSFDVEIPQDSGTSKSRLECIEEQQATLPAVIDYESDYSVHRDVFNTLTSEEQAFAYWYVTKGGKRGSHADKKSIWQMQALRRKLNRRLEKERQKEKEIHHEEEYSIT